MDLEKLNLALLNSALTTTSEQSQRRLTDEESLDLTMLVAETAKRYPSQDLTDSVGVIMQDLEQLALKYSLPRVRKALEALRIKAGQKFFPRPDEVAEEIEEQRERNLQDAMRRDGDRWTQYWRAETARINAERDTPEFKEWLASLKGNKDAEYTGSKDSGGS